MWGEMQKRPFASVFLLLSRETSQESKRLLVTGSSPPHAADARELPKELLKRQTAAQTHKHTHTYKRENESLGIENAEVLMHMKRLYAAPAAKAASGLPPQPD